MITLRPIEESDIYKIKEWRNIDSIQLRTPFKINNAMQKRWYDQDVSNRELNYKYYAICKDEKLIGYGGLEIDWYNRGAELGLLIGRENQSKGYGKDSVDLLLKEAFHSLNMDSVYIESYVCNPSRGFWKRILEIYKPLYVEIPYRVYREGKYWGSDYYVILKENFK